MNDLWEAIRKLSRDTLYDKPADPSLVLTVMAGIEALRNERGQGVPDWYRFGMQLLEEKAAESAG